MSFDSSSILCSFSLLILLLLELFSIFGTMSWDLDGHERCLHPGGFKNGFQFWLPINLFSNQSTSFDFSSILCSFSFYSSSSWIILYFWDNELSNESLRFGWVNLISKYEKYLDSELHVLNLRVDFNLFSNQRASILLPFSVHSLLSFFFSNYSLLDFLDDTMKNEWKMNRECANLISFPKFFFFIFFFAIKNQISFVRDV